jgi:hypothetical protein
MHTVTTSERLPQAWQKAFRAFLPSLPTAGLGALATALADDERSLIQNATTFPPPLDCASDWPIAAACAIALDVWKGHGLATVGQVGEAFALACAAADARLGAPAACRDFLNWFDETDRAAMRHALLAEVGRALADRDQPAQATA